LPNKFVYVLDFDGTITARDITGELSRYFGGNKFNKLIASYERDSISIQGFIEGMAQELPPDLDHLTDLSLKLATTREGFDFFLKKVKEEGALVTIASDGFGFYIEPILRRENCLDKIDYIFCNELQCDEKGRTNIKFPYAHHACNICGNCKAAHVARFKEEGYQVIYAGDGKNDWFGASLANLVFARDKLAALFEQEGKPYRPWETFYDLV